MRVGRNLKATKELIGGGLVCSALCFDVLPFRYISFSMVAIEGSGSSVGGIVRASSSDEQILGSLLPTLPWRSGKRFQSCLGWLRPC